nr:PAS domain S-box protein [Terriglobales bacterium]
GEIILVNLQAERQFGYRHDELLGQKVSCIIPKGFAERLLTYRTGFPDAPVTQPTGTGIELRGRR